MQLGRKRGLQTAGFITTLAKLNSLSGENVTVKTEMWFKQAFICEFSPQWDQ